MKIETNGKEFKLEINREELIQLWGNSLTAYTMLKDYGDMLITKDLIKTMNEALKNPF